MSKHKQPKNPSMDCKPHVAAPVQPSMEPVRPVSKNDSGTGEYYRDIVTHYRWSMGILVTVFLAFLAYVVYRDSRAYENAVRDAKEAAKQASDWEARAHDRFNTIDTTVAQKLMEIENKGTETTAKQLKELGQQRTLLELWAQVAFHIGNPEGTYVLMEKIMAVDPNSALAEQTQAEAAFWSAYGARDDPVKCAKWAEIGIEIRKKIEARERGSQAFNLACNYALLDREDDCRSWLKVAQDASQMPKRELLSDQVLEVLNRYKTTDWFKLVKWGDEKVPEKPIK